MADENQTPSSAPGSTATTEPTVEPTTTLADVAKKYNVDQMVQNFTATPESRPAQASPQTFTPPDPILNPDQWNQYQASVVQQSVQTQGLMKDLSSKIESLTKEAHQAKLDTEVNRAVSKVNDKLKVEPLYAEIALEKRYRDDPIFRRIWDNRQVNPKALDEALDVISNELSGVFQVKSDPQLAENLRAAKQSQRSMATTSKEDSETEKLMGLNDVEFDREWNRRKRGY